LANGSLEAGKSREASARRLSDAERLAWLRLIRSEHVGPITFHELLAHFGGARAALDALPEMASRGGGRRGARICPLDEAERELEAAAKCGAALAALGEADYPSLLAQIDAPPPLVYVKGVAGLWGRPVVAIVGSRNASALGRRFAHGLSADLGAAGFVVVSGLARGIDTAAHEGALASGAPAVTAAVTAGGVDVIYPPENARLHERIVSTGTILSESPPGFHARAQDFPRRNRLISGMSLGVIVVEAAERSGSLITARFALEQNRQVFAVPGHPLDPRSEGANGLLRQGARIVTGARDVIDELTPMMAPPGCSAFAPGAESGRGASDRSAQGRLDLGLPRAQAAARASVGVAPPPAESEVRSHMDQVLEALGAAPASVDEVIRVTGLGAAAVNVALFELELAGRLQRHPGQLVSLR
jgi:DNA processing protein